MTNILVAICRNSRKNFKRHYLKKKIFSDSLLHFWNVHEMQNILNKKVSILALFFPRLSNPKVGVT